MARQVDGCGGGDRQRSPNARANEGAVSEIISDPAVRGRFSVLDVEVNPLPAVNR